MLVIKPNLDCVQLAFLITSPMLAFVSSPSDKILAALSTASVSSRRCVSPCSSSSSPTSPVPCKQRRKRPASSFYLCKH
jgi:hypothetical protein